MCQGGRAAGVAVAWKRGESALEFPVFSRHALIACRLSLVCQRYSLILDELAVSSSGIVFGGCILPQCP